MNTKDILFTTGRFNRTKVGSHFINDCCFGEDVAAWFSEKLTEHQVEILRSPYQEDWGWEMSVSLQGARYYLGFGAQADDSETDDGEWRILVTKRRSLLDRLLGRGRIQSDDPMLKMIEAIASEPPDFQNVYIE